MDSLEEFEKTLAAEKSVRESGGKEKKDRKHKHRHHHHHHHHHRDRSDHHRSMEEDNDERQDIHRQKRSRRLRDEEEEDRPRRHIKTSDSKGDIPLPSEEPPSSPKQGPQRDSWMTDPTALGIDYTQRGAKKAELSNTNPQSDDNLKSHKMELNHRLREELADNRDDMASEPAQHEVDYTFGDAGSQWRMTKLKAVYDQAKTSDRSLEEVALERYGDLRDFDDAREEETELERRKLYGTGYIGKEKPSGELFQERKMSMGIRRERQPVHNNNNVASRGLPQGQILEEMQIPVLDQTMLNRMKAQMMKAKLKNSLDAANLEEEYNKALVSFTRQGPDIVTLGIMENRMLAGTRGEVKSIDNKRGRERGLVGANEDMTIEEMVQEERRSKGLAGGEAQRFAERIAKDAKFDDSLDYLDENSDKLAKRVQKSEINLKNSSINEYQKMTRILDNCPLCHHEDKNLPPAAPLISLGTRVYLTLPTEPEVSEGGAVIVPIQHRTNLLECDDDEWEEIRNFMKCLTRMYHDQGRDVVFYENAAAPHRKLHAAMQAVPLPYSHGEMAPAFFKEAILASDEEWTQHKKLIDTAARARDGLGKAAFRQSIAKEMPYFHVWFTLDGGLGHIVEDLNRWPKGDLFVREIVGGMLDVELDVIKRQGRWIRGIDRRMEGFKKRWKKFDWTRVLTDGQ